MFEIEKFTVDVTKSPMPRFDLLNFDYYLHIGVQFSRGCPFTCEFCDIIELYGRVPRAKTNAQMLAELDELYRLGYRGHVDFVDDNLIGNKKAVRTFMPELKDWLERNDYPFEFTTEASVNLADDDDFLKAMSEANFVGVFVGIESPDPDTLVAMKKKQNTRRSLVESIHKIYAAGIFVTAGFIVGFDSEKGSIADGMIEADRGGGDPGLHGRPALRAAQHAADAPADQGGPPASGAPIFASAGLRRSMHPGTEFRHAAAASRRSCSITSGFWKRSTSQAPMRRAWSVWQDYSTRIRNRERLPAIFDTDLALRKCSPGS